MRYLTYHELIQMHSCASAKCARSRTLVRKARPRGPPACTFLTQQKRLVKTSKGLLLERISSNADCAGDTRVTCSWILGAWHDEMPFAGHRRCLKA